MVSVVILLVRIEWFFASFVSSFGVLRAFVIAYVEARGDVDVDADAGKSH